MISTHRTEYPKPGKPVFHAASIQEDLRRRDFTVNAMAISLNEGSFGLLMDPLNGAADIEARTLRLVSNYGFLEEPSLMIRATRYRARLGWELDPRTQTRYDNAREEGVIELLSAHARSQELEQIGHEDDGLKVMHALESEGWMKVLFPAWTPAKADEEKLKALHELAVQLQMQGVHPDMSAAQMQLLTAKLPAKDLSALKKLMLRPGFVEEWNSLDSLAAGFAKALVAKENQTPSATFKLFTSYDPEAVLWLGFTSNAANVRERYEQFLKVWPEARQRIPHALMQEMRITPDLATYPDIIHRVFLELIDGRLTTPEEIRAFLEPHSPPAPPPQVTIKRSRAKRGAEAKVKERSYDDEDEEDLDEEEDLDDIGGEDEEIDLGIVIPKRDLEPDLAEEGEAEDEEAEESEPESTKPTKKQAGQKPPKDTALAAAVKPEKHASESAQKKSTGTDKHQPAVNPKSESKGAPKQVVAKTAAVKPNPAVATPAKKAPAPALSKGAPIAKATTKEPAKVPVKAAIKQPAKTSAKTSSKAPAKPVSKPAAKHAPAKSKPAHRGSKPAVKAVQNKHATKAGKRR